MERNNGKRTFKKEETTNPITRAEQLTIIDRVMYPFKHVGADLESILKFNNKRYMVDLNHPKETLDRWNEFKKRKTTKDSEQDGLKQAAESTPGKVHITEEPVEMFSSEELLDVHPLTRRFLEATDRIRDEISASKKELFEDIKTDNKVLKGVLEALRLFIRGV